MVELVYKFYKSYRECLKNELIAKLHSIFFLSTNTNTDGILIKYFDCNFPLYPARAAYAG